MPHALLDIHDTNLQLWNGSGAVDSPGYALLQDRNYLFGRSARAAARLRPRDINTRFWNQLSTEALRPALGPARHTADLAHAQLLDMHKSAGEPGQLVVAVSDTMHRDQQAQLLGIIGQCPFDAVGLVNRSSALATTFGGGRDCYHLELQLHQAVISRLTVQDDEIVLDKSIPLPGCGLLQIQERLVETIASTFIRQTRFDPRRKAEVEQSLYDCLPTTLDELRGHSETNLELNGYQARINHRDLVTAGERLVSSALEAMGNSSGSMLMLDPLADRLPGVSDAFANAVLLPQDALWQSYCHLGDAVEQTGDALHFLTRLPLNPATQHIATVEPAVFEPEAPAPTHLLSGHQARPITGEQELVDGLSLLSEKGRLHIRSENNTAFEVNGVSGIENQSLSAGDVIELPDGSRVQLIEVLQ